MAIEAKQKSSPGKAQPIPADYGSITPYIVVRGAADFIEFLKNAFGAEERGRVPNPDGTLGHAEVWIGDSVVQMFDARENWPDTPSFITMYFEDCDATYQRALKAGATKITAPLDTPFGDRVSRVRDPFGNLWWIQSHVEDVDNEEMFRRMEEKPYQEAMQTLQETLDREMSSRGKG
jgi:PhnB protein